MTPRYGPSPTGWYRFSTAGWPLDALGKDNSSMIVTIFRKSLLPLIGVLLTLVLVGQLRNGRGSDSVEAAPAPAPVQDERVVAEGRLVTYPGAEVAVATELPGMVVRLLVDEKDRVRKGQVIAELRAD